MIEIFAPRRAAFRASIVLLITVTASSVLAQSGVLPVGPRRISYGFFDPAYPRSESDPALRRQHLGVDMPTPAGTVVRSPVAGVVVASETRSSDIMQKYLIVRMADGTEHVFGHLNSKLAKGASVVAGDPIGTIADWGSNSHLHWGIHRGSTLAVMSSTWGWGRAPLNATEAEARAKGWTNGGR